MALNLFVSSKVQVSCIMANCADSSALTAVTNNHTSKNEFLMLKPTSLLQPDPNVT